MTVPVHPLTVDAVVLADEWFASLGKPFRGRLHLDDPLLPAGGAGWLVWTLGRELAVIVDTAFPFTRPKVYLRRNEEALPHVERDGRLCLRNPEIPSDPAIAVRLALGEARSLLRDIMNGSEDIDFEEDFSLYWRQSAETGFRARLLLSEVQGSGLISWTATNAAAYGFATPGALKRWWQNRFGTDRVKVRQGVVVAMDRLPSPELYPRTSSDLWDLVADYSSDGIEIFSQLLRQTPKSLLIVLAGTAPSGRRHVVGLKLARATDARGQPLNRRAIERGHARGKAPADAICECYRVIRLGTEALDAAGTRLPYAERDRLAAAKVAVIGCGALGSGVARLLAKSGVGNLVLVDPELLGWENIRRHQLGAADVGAPKASALASAIASENPDIGSVRGHDELVERLLLQNAKVLESVDLVVACTASWSANSALDSFAEQEGRPPVLYAWMEAHAVAAHALLILTGHSYRSGYDVAGNSKLNASLSSKPIPAECGALTSLFGAVELAQAEALAARLAMDYLRGQATATIWRTWLTDAEALAEAEGSWTEEWIAARGTPSAYGEISVGQWWEP